MNRAINMNDLWNCNLEKNEKATHFRCCLSHAIFLDGVFQTRWQVNRHSWTRNSFPFVHFFATLCQTADQRQSSSVLSRQVRVIWEGLLHWSGEFDGNVRQNVRRFEPVIVREGLPKINFNDLKIWRVHGSIIWWQDGFLDQPLDIQYFNALINWWFMVWWFNDFKILRLDGSMLWLYIFSII